MTVGWCFRDQSDPYTEGALDALADGEALVPAIWPLEIANVLLVAERRRRLSRGETTRLLELLGALPISVQDATFANVASDVLALGREHALSSYDAAYLDLAARTGLPLATRDAALVSACARAGVPLLR